MKKFFQDDTLTCQKMPIEALKTFFNIPDDYINDSQEKEKFIVLFNYKDENYSIQICFNILPNFDNNYYLILVFDKNEELLHNFSHKSHVLYPPVWNREFGYIDYLDFLAIQKYINKVLDYNKLPLMEYDFSVQKRSFYFTKESVEDVAQLIKDGKPYGICSIFAEKAPDMVLMAKKQIGFDKN